VEIFTHPIDDVLPQIIGGENACPPEDCGGIYGHKELKEILLNPKHSKYKSTKRWAGNKFNPLHFEIAEAQKNLKNLKQLIDDYEDNF
jgi:hypothetical protein